MDKIALQQGLKWVMYAIVLAFMGPFVIDLRRGLVLITKAFELSLV